METFTCSNFSDLDQNTLKDFVECFEESSDEIEFSLAKLETIQNGENLDRLFRSLHSLKGNFNMCYLEPMVDIVHKVEQLIQAVRNGEHAYSLLHNEFITIILGHLKDSINGLMLDQFGNQTFFTKLHEIIDKVLQVTHEDHQQILESAINSLSAINTQTYGTTEAYIDEVDYDNSSSTAIEDTITKCGTEVEIQTFGTPLILPRSSSPQIREDAIDFYRNMAFHLDSSLPNRNGRTLEELFICKNINEKLGMPVDEEAFKTAIYAHDLGMAFVPQTIIGKTSELSREELRQVRYHLYVGNSLLKHLGGHEEAADIVWQHHEYYNGSGYPQKRVGKNIHIGARILAVADTFCSTTRDRADRTFKKSLLRAVQEINSHTESQYDPEVVELFNDVIKERFVRSKQY